MTMFRITEQDGNIRYEVAESIEQMESWLNDGEECEQLGEAKEGLHFEYDSVFVEGEEEPVSGVYVTKSGYVYRDDPANYYYLDVDRNDANRDPATELPCEAWDFNLWVCVAQDGIDLELITLIK